MQCPSEQTNKNLCCLNLKDGYHRYVRPYWKSWIVVFTPLVLLPIYVIGDTPVTTAPIISTQLLVLKFYLQEAKTGYVILLMTVYWVSMALPLPVTSLLPIALFPFMNIMGTNEVCNQYFKGSTVVFVCGVALSLGVEQCKLYRRVALRSLLLVGTNPEWFVLQFRFNHLLYISVNNNILCAG